MGSNKKNIIFDLDGTLIDVQSTVGASSALVLGRGVPAHTCNADFAGLRIYKRPGLDDLLDWCFSNFDNVGIWTLSPKEWLDEVLDNVLKAYPRDKWSILWCGDRATRVEECENPDGLELKGAKVIKDLKKVFKNKELKRRGFSPNNTLIVEDNPSNCIRNLDNAIYVTPFDILSRQLDDQLKLLQKYLATRVVNSKNVKSLEKDGWYTEISKEERKVVKKSDTAFWMRSDWKAPKMSNIAHIPITF